MGAFLMRQAVVSRTGLTLVEVIVVVAVIALLAAAVIPAVGGLLPSSRGTNKSGDLREMTITTVRYRQEVGELPILQAEPPTERVRDDDNDGVIRMVVDTTAADGAGPAPAGVDVTCTATTASLADAFAECFGSVDITLLREFLKNRPQHALEDVTNADGSTPTYDNQQDTVDFSATSVTLFGSDLEVYVKDDGTAGGTAFPTGALRVWNVDGDGQPFALKNEDHYGE